jgi:type III secretion system YscD/HrpQ family protein
MLGHLIPEEGPEQGSPLLFTDGETWTIGRDSTLSNIVIEDPKVSRSHAQCTLSPEGWMIENLSDTNPITHNDTTLTQPSLLKEGDRLKIGSYWYSYTENTPPPTSEAETEAPPLDHEENNEENEPEIEDEDNSHDTIFKEFDDASFENLHIDLSETTRWMLKVISGPNTGAEFSMEENKTYIIGSDSSSSDIIFNDRSVSRKHLSISIENETIHIEDLKSRNGSLIDNKEITTPTQLQANQTVSTGTTTFIILDREHPSETIISPSAPTEIKPEPQINVATTPSPEIKEEIPKEIKPPTTKKKKPPTPSIHALLPYLLKQWEYIKSTNLKYIIPIALLAFILLLTGISALFSSKQVQIQTVDYSQKIETALQSFSDIQYTYNSKNGKLFLMGHILTGVAHKKLTYTLQQLPFIKEVEDHTVIDDGVWQEMNLILYKVEKWKGISAHASEPGEFVINGYLKTREELEELDNYINLNFAFLDRLKNNVVVEEDIIDKTSSSLFTNGFVDVILQVNNGEVTLTGFIPASKQNQYKKVIQSFDKIHGVRGVKNFVVELEKTNFSVINISDNYNVTGSSFHDNAPVNVIINGKILTKGDAIDGMKIIDIERRTVYLEKDGVKYKIDYNN